MTGDEIRTALRQLTPAQRRFLQGVITHDWHGVGRGRWRTLDALVAKGLLRGVLVQEGTREVLRYLPSALVVQCWQQSQEPAAALPPHQEDTP